MTSQYDGRQMRQRLVALDVAAGLQAVHAGHAPVHEHDVVRVGRIVLLDGGDGFFAGGDGVHTRGQRPQRLLHYFARGGVVVYDEHAELSQFFRNNFFRTTG